MAEGARYDRIQAEMERMIANAPGADRGEKLAWCWQQPAYAKLYKALTALGQHEHPLPKPYDKQALRYYVRFADRPPTPGFRSSVWYGSKQARQEKGISAYPARWSQKHHAWELERLDGLASGPEDSVSDLLDRSKLKAWLLTGPETGETGSDGEPLLNGDDIKVVKQLSPLELVVPGYYDPADLEPEEQRWFRHVPFSPHKR